jgi:hypothetical protein
MNIPCALFFAAPSPGGRGTFRSGATCWPLDRSLDQSLARSLDRRASKRSTFVSPVLNRSLPSVRGLARGFGASPLSMLPMLAERIRNVQLELDAPALVLSVNEAGDFASSRSRLEHSL